MIFCYHYLSFSEKKENKYLSPFSLSLRPQSPSRLGGSWPFVICMGSSSRLTWKWGLLYTTHSPLSFHDFISQVRWISETLLRLISNSFLHYSPGKSWAAITKMP
jgi:hypothetical protein